MTAGGRHGLVLGGGLAGALAARVLAEHVQRVIVVDRDGPELEPLPRKGVPQAWHSHLLLGTGARAIERLLPGTIGTLLGAGAHRVPMLADLAMHTKYGWLPRVGAEEFALCCSRALVDWAVRRRSFADERITLLPRTEVLGLAGDPGLVRGARVRDRDTGRRERIDADFVVAAPGRSAHVADWLTGLGLPPVPVQTIDSGTAYASRIYRVPPELRDTPPVILVPDAGSRGLGGVLLPLEGDRWTVTLIGMRGAEPPVDEPGFVRFAESLPDPVIAGLIARAHPVGPVRGFRGLLNRRFRFDRLDRWPEGLVVAGDAVCTLNPAHAHGMTVTAFGIEALRETLAAQGIGVGAARTAQRAVGRSADLAWAQAGKDDLRHPLVRGMRPNARVRLENRIADRLMSAGTTDAVVARALLAVLMLSRSPLGIITPAIVLAALRRAGGRPAPDTSASMRPRRSSVVEPTSPD